MTKTGMENGIKNNIIQDERAVNEKAEDLSEI
jgi:hypothetical protein